LIIFLQGGAELTEDTIAESGISLLLAGTDTSGGGSTAALAMLAQFPQVMQRLRQEQQQVCDCWCGVGLISGSLC
jgi:cytochrome P450